MSLTLTRSLVFFDLETTGTDIQNDRIVEISLIKLYPDNKEEINTLRINPGIPIPPEATAVHGIGNKDVADKPSFLKTAPAILEILSNSDLCGYNLLRFDFPFLRMEFARNNIEFNISGINLIDPLRIFIKNEPRDLSAALQFYCNENLDDAHSAEADIIATKKVLLAQLERYPDIPKTVAGLSEYSTEGSQRYADISGKLMYNDKNEIVFAFGKHKNKKVIDNPDYCNWILSSDFADDTKSIIRDLLSGNQ